MNETVQLAWRLMRHLVGSRPDLSNREITDKVSDVLGVKVDGRTVAGLRHSRWYRMGKAQAQRHLGEKVDGRTVAGLRHSKWYRMGKAQDQPVA